MTDGEQHKSEIETDVDTRRVLLVTPFLAACLDLAIQYSQTVGRSGSPTSTQEVLSAIDLQQTLSITPLYSVVVFPILWLGLWWQFNGRPLPEQVISRGYRREIQWTTALVAPFPVISISVLVGVYTGQFEPVMLAIFDDVPTALLVLVMYYLWAMVIGHFVLGVLIWLDYRHLEKQDESSPPILTIGACMMASQTLGLSALLAAWYWLRSRETRSVLISQPEVVR